MLSFNVLDVVAPLVCPTFLLPFSLFTMHALVARCERRFPLRAVYLGEGLVKSRCIFDSNKKDYREGIVYDKKESGKTWYRSREALTSKSDKAKNEYEDDPFPQRSLRVPCSPLVAKLMCCVIYGYYTSAEPGRNEVHRRA